MKLLRRIGVIAALLFAGGALADSHSHDAAGFVSTFGSKAETILNAAELSDGERNARLRLLLTDSIDLPRLSRFALGRFWDRATPTQKADYQALFSNFVVNTYVDLLASQDAEKFDVLGLRPQPGPDALVRTRIERPSGEVIDADFHIGRNGSGYRVYDITTDGISMAETYRSAVSSVVAVGGMPSLLAVLRARQ